MVGIKRLNPVIDPDAILCFIALAPDLHNGSHLAGVALFVNNRPHSKGLRHCLYRLRCNTHLSWFRLNADWLRNTDRVSMLRVNKCSPELLGFVDVASITIEQFHKVDVPCHSNFHLFFRIVKQSRMCHIITNLKHLPDGILHFMVIRKILIVAKRVQIALDHTKQSLQVKAVKRSDIIALHLFQLHIRQVRANRGLPPVTRVYSSQTWLQPFTAQLCCINEVLIHF